MGKAFRQVRKLGAVAMAAAMVVAGAGFGSAALAAGSSSSVKSEEQWLAGNGTVGLRWNRELAADIGLSLAPATARLPELSWYEHEQFDLQGAGTLSFEQDVLL